MRIALGIEYDGAYFCGVQDALEKAISKIAQHPVRVHAAGRTDTGVHALMQVVHFDTTSFRADNTWVRGVNAFLPPSVRVVWSKVVTEDFHARFSAQLRHYEYMLVNDGVSPAILASKVGWYHLPLQLEPMQQGARYLIGEHDFSAFRASECQAKTSIRTMHDASVKQQGKRFIFNFSANAFLQHQVRNMLGALIYVGNGKHPPAFIESLLTQQDRNLSPPTFSPSGLYLTGVDYGEQWQLSSGAQHIGLI